MIDHEWVAKAAGYMTQARPDLWDQYGAEQQMYEWIAELSEHEHGCSIGTGSFMLTKEIDPDAEPGEEITFALSRNVVDICTYKDESEPAINRGFDWISNSEKNSRSVDTYFDGDYGDIDEDS